MKLPKLSDLISVDGAGVIYEGKVVARGKGFVWAVYKSGDREIKQRFKLRTDGVWGLFIPGMSFPIKPPM